MRYTLWQRGVLIGETDFGLGRLPGGRRAGVFHPAPSGMTVLPTLTAMAPALVGLSAAMDRLPLCEDETQRDADAAVRVFASSRDGRRVLAAAEQIAELELRDATGRHVAFESILLSDLRDLAALGVEHRAVRGQRGNEVERDPVRYVLTVTLSERRVREARVRH